MFGWSILFKGLSKSIQNISGVSSTYRTQNVYVKLKKKLKKKYYCSFKIYLVNLSTKYNKKLLLLHF